MFDKILTIASLKRPGSRRHEEKIELLLFRFDLITDFVYILEKREIFLDETCLCIWLYSFELREDSVGGILVPVYKILASLRNPRYGFPRILLPSNKVYARLIGMAIELLESAFPNAASRANYENQRAANVYRFSLKKV